MPVCVTVCETLQSFSCHCSACHSVDSNCHLTTVFRTHFHTAPLLPSNNSTNAVTTFSAATHAKLLSAARTRRFVMILLRTRESIMHYRYEKLF